MLQTLDYTKRAAPTFPAWTDGAVARLEAMNAKGFTARDIARELSVEFGCTFTRNAVIGKIHRLGIAEQRATARGDDPRVQMIRDLSEEGLSRREIMCRVGCGFQLLTAVLGRLPKKEGSHRRGGAKRIDRVWSAPAVRAETGFTAESIRIGFSDLGPSSCRWPVGHPGKDMLFCGAERIDGHSYCAAHCRAAYTPVQKRSAAPAPVRNDKTFRRFA